MNIKDIKYRNLKLFWIIKIEKLISENNLSSRITEKNWKEILWGKDSAKSIDEHAIEIFNQIWGSSEGRGYTINNLPFSSEESIKYSKVKSEDEKEEKELDNLEKEKNSLKKLVNNYETDIKSIIGNNELTKWNEKVVKANIKDQDIVNLQKKVTDLTKLKKETEKQLKEKEQQITTLSNHKCDTPQGKELNLWKERVIKLTTEKDKLQSQLEQKEKNNSNSKGANYSHWILGGIGILIVGFLIYLLVIQKKKKNK